MLVGTDPPTDLAVLQISADQLPQATLGTSQHLQVGDWVVAIGDALALPGGPTVTQGVVSALGQSVQEPRNARAGVPSQGPTLFDAIQTDAPINPGNSGRPLTNLQGHVVGINTLVAGQAEPGIQAQGIGFAIAIDTAKPIVDQIVTTGHAIHPLLGISLTTLNPPIAARLGRQATSGVVVVQVALGSPATTSLRPRDVITQADGQALVSDADLARLISRHQPGDALELTVLRGNQPMTVTVTLAERPPNSSKGTRLQCSGLYFARAGTRKRSVWPWRYLPANPSSVTCAPTRQCFACPAAPAHPLQTLNCVPVRSSL
jgi:S1-C subfamily serine protease